MCTIIKQIQRHSFVTFYWLHEWFFCRNQRHITQSINWEILKTKSQQNSVFLNQKLSFSNLFWTSVIITFSVRSDMVRTSHLSMIAGPKDHLCKILKALTGIVRRQFPSLRGTTWRNNGRRMWNGSRFEHICAIYVEITNIHGWNWKCHVIIIIKTDLSGFVVPMHSDLCEQYVTTGLNPLNYA